MSHDSIGGEEATHRKWVAHAFVIGLSAWGAYQFIRVMTS